MKGVPGCNLYGGQGKTGSPPTQISAVWGLMICTLGSSPPGTAAGTGLPVHWISPPQLTGRRSQSPTNTWNKISCPPRASGGVPGALSFSEQVSPVTTPLPGDSNRQRCETHTPLIFLKQPGETLGPCCNSPGFPRLDLGARLFSRQGKRDMEKIGFCFLEKARHLFPRKIP